MEKNGKARVFYRGTVWDAKPEKGSPMVPGLWEIVGMSGNTLIIKLKQEK
ncbi:NfeD family protein [Parasutterella excrementihominis]